MKTIRINPDSVNVQLSEREVKTLRNVCREYRPQFYLPSLLAGTLHELLNMMEEKRNGKV